MALKPISRIAAGVQASTTLVIDSLFKQMKAEGKDVVGFGAGEPDFPTPEHIKQAGIEAIENNQTRYTPAAGLMELREAACYRLKADFGLDSGRSATSDSVVNTIEATEAAFCSAERVTLVGSTMPASVMTTYSSLEAS